MLNAECLMVRSWGYFDHKILEFYYRTVRTRTHAHKARQMLNSFLCAFFYECCSWQSYEKSQLTSANDEPRRRTRRPRQFSNSAIKLEKQADGYLRYQINVECGDCGYLCDIFFQRELLERVANLNLYNIIISYIEF